MTDFILRKLVRDVLGKSSDADPGDVAAAVLRRIPKNMTHVALEQALRLFVRQVISETRISRSGRGPTPIRSGRSGKVAAIRDGWQKRLKDRVHVGSGDWKFLADCTYGDLLAAASERRQLADRNQAWARQYDAWAALLTDHDVKVFADLPAEVQMNALGRAA